MKRTIAIVGLGTATRTIHLPAYSKLQDLEVVGGVDPAVNNQDFLFPVFASLDAMLDETVPDILTIATPTVHHYELTRKGLLAGCHIFCEKPFMTTLEEVDKIISLSRELQRWVIVNNQFRFMSIHQAAKQRIGRPNFGDLLFISARQAFRVTEQTEAGWRGDDPQRTCKEFGTHVLDLCRYFFGEDPHVIYARMPKGKYPDGPDLLNLIQLEFSGDRVAHIILDRLSQGRNRYLDIRLDGSKGTVETRLGGGLAFSAGIRGGDRKPFVEFDVSFGGRTQLHHGEQHQNIAKDPLDVFAQASSELLAEFLKALDHNLVPPCNAKDNRRTLALMLAAYESAARRRPIDMHY